MKANTLARSCSLAFFTLVTAGTAARAAEPLLFNTEREVPVAELLDLLDIAPGLNTTAQVSASASGPFAQSANLGGHLSCRADGDDVIIAAGAGPAASATCHARVCTSILGLGLVCGTTGIDVRSTACLEAGPGSVDPGCDGDAPVCTGGADAHCVECEADLHCGPPSGTFGLGLGQVANVTLGLVHELLGLDLLVPLSTVQVGANVNGPFSDEAVLENGATCAIANDGSVDLVASAEESGASTCYVEVCVPSLGTCLVTELDLLVDGCLLGEACNPIQTCDQDTNTCIACRDDEEPGYIDSGCTSPNPVCHEDNREDARCVECESAIDCTGKLLTVQLGPGRETVVELSRITNLLRLGTLLNPSDVKVSADVDGPFADEATLDADAALTGCSVDADGNVMLAAAGVEGEAVCYVQVCATLLGNTVETCLSAPITVKVDACVLDRSCDLNPRCDDEEFTCTDACFDSAPPGGIDYACDADTPACAGNCFECLEDADCTPKRPLLDLDLGDTGEILLDDILAALQLDANVLIDSVQVAAKVEGPFEDTTTLDVKADVAQCLVDADGNVEVIATTTVYGTVRCYVEVCAGVLETIEGCAVLPIEVNIDPCAADDSCRPQICDTNFKTCTECIDTGNGIDQGCDAEKPNCGEGSNGEPRCVECENDGDCSGGEVCQADRCVPCSDTTHGGTDEGCDNAAPACDEDPIVGSSPTCVECTEDADCDSDVCDEATRACVECEDTAAGSGIDEGCDNGTPICLPDAQGDGHCEECATDADCAGNDVCDTASHTCETCRDDSVGDVDEGCAAQNPACDEAPLAGGDPICVECTDDEDCASNACDEATRTCEGCDTDADCAGDEVCTSNHTCQTCLDDTIGGTDEGCTNAVPACDTSPLGGGDARCVDCTVDADCDNFLCDEATRTCEECQDTAAGNGLDVGCTLTTPICLGEDGGGEHCVECDDDGDCAASEYCSDENTCERCEDNTIGGIDRGCGETLSACDESPVGGGLPNCVECTADADCDSGLCDESARRCVDCQDTAEGDGVDAGCNGEEPICTSGLLDDEHCVECLDDGDCDGDDECRLVTHTCVDPSAIVAIDDRFEIGFGLVLNVAAGGVLANDSGPSGGGSLQARAIVATLPDEKAVGVVVLAADGSLVFTPALGFAGTFSFDYQVSATNAVDAIGTVTITVGANRPPSGSDEDVTTPEDVAVLIVVLANDGDPEGQRLVVEDVFDPFVGTVDLRPDGTVVYIPAPDYFGDDTFDYLVCDTFDACTDATVHVRITARNDAPHAADDIVVVDVPGGITVDVLANDGDPDGDALHIGTLDLGGLAGGALAVDGRIVITPTLGFTGETGFWYEACDDAGACARAFVSVFVGVDPSGDVSVDAADDLIATRAGLAATVDLLANDTVVGDGTLVIAAWSAPENGHLAVSAAGEVTYRPAVGFVGEDAFSYTACIGRRCDVAIVRVTVSAGENQAPVALDDLVTTLLDVPVIVSVLGNDYDPDGDALEVTAVATLPGHGQATLRVDGGLDYVPAAGFVGIDRFEVEIGDGHGGSDRSVVTVIVLDADNTAPDAQDDRFEVDGIPLAGELVDALLDVLDNDRDADGDALVIDVVVQPLHGSARIDAGGHLAYQPVVGFVGVDVLSYRVSDGRGGFDMAEVTVVIGLPNIAPSVVDDVLTTAEDTATNIDVLANDDDPDGEGLDISVSVEPEFGRVVVLGDGRLSYIPALDFFGDDGLVYTACDSVGACASADVAIEVTPVNDAPVARDDAGTMLAAAGLTVDVLANDTDVDDERLAIGDIGLPNVGSIVSLDGELSIIAPLAFTGELTFTYDACDAGGLCSTATVRIDVTGKSTAPELRDDLATTQANVEVTVDVLANDTDPEGDTMAISTLSRADHGEVRVVQGKVAYLPSENYVGLDSFTYIACDLGGLCGQARVSVTVTIPATNVAPDARDDIYDASVPRAHRIDVLANDSDPDGDPIRLVGVSQGAQGTATIGTDGKLVYTPVEGARGGDLVTYTACDTWNVCDTAKVEITLAPLDVNGFELSGGPTCSSGGTATFMALVFAISFLAIRRAMRRERGVLKRRA